jgi:hypothetical protein
VIHLSVLLERVNLCVYYVAFSRIGNDIRVGEGDVAPRRLITKGRPLDPRALRVMVDGRWNATEFSTLFHELDQLYLMAQFGLREMADDQGLSTPQTFQVDWRRRSWNDPELEAQMEECLGRHAVFNFIGSQLENGGYQLAVAGVSVASPGVTDLAGVGRFISEIRKFVMAIADRYIAKADRDLDRDAKRQRILKAKLDNVEKLMKLSKKLGLSQEIKNELVRQALGIDAFIEEKILEGKITGFQELDRNGKVVS